MSPKGKGAQQSSWIMGLSTPSLTGCATYETILTNDHGNTMTCKASGKNGLITGYYLRKGFDDCVDRAKAAGYHDDVTSTPAPPTKQ